MGYLSGRDQDIVHPEHVQQKVIDRCWVVGTSGRPEVGVGA